MTDLRLRTCGFLLTVTLCTGAALAETAAPAAAGDWSSYGHDVYGSHFSELGQLTPQNVNQLRIIWAHHLRPGGADQADTSALRPSEATPLVVAGVMYVPTPYGEVIALNADSGVQRWAFRLPNNDRPATRGVAYWPGDARQPARIFVGTRDGELFALRAADGKTMADFGTDGRIDMKTVEVMNGYPEAQLGMSSPPLVFRNLVITGSQVQEFPPKGASGDVRAWDAHTGRLVWTFHTIPGPGEAGHDTWEGDSWRGRSGVNMWTSAVADPKLGLVYLPIAAPAFDRWGGDRKGANLFSNSIVAVDGASGSYRWHFQTIHHDLWDLDLPAATLLEVKKGGKSIPAIGVANKSALLFLLDRRTGRPIYEVKEVPVPTQTQLPGEAPWPTQPMPVTPPPLARMSFNLAELNDLTPEIAARCRKLVQEWKIVASEPFQPPRSDAAVAHFPGGQGGVNWGGAAFDPVRGYYIVNITNMASPAQLGEDDGAWGLAFGYRYFWDIATRIPCQRPPWGELVAVDVGTATIAWRKTLGVTDSLPEASANTGRPSAGGVIATASGLTFVGATDDQRLRAFDSASGRLLWERRLPASVYATPMTYRSRSGRQFLAVVATGGMTSSEVTDDEVIVFGLPTKSELRHSANEPTIGLPTAHGVLARTQPPLATSAVEAADCSSVHPSSGPGLDLLNHRCINCHPAAQIYSAPRRSSVEWLKTVRRMEERGAVLTPKEEQDISAYLGQQCGVWGREGQ